MLIKELAQLCNAQPSGGDTSQSIHTAADIMSAHAHQVTVLSDGKYKKYLKDCQSSACFISEQLAEGSDAPATLTLLICKDPEISFLNAVKALHPEPHLKRQVSEHAVLADTATLGFDTHVGPFATIGQHSSVGDSSTIEASVHIGNHVAIGKNCRIHPNVVIYDHSVIGNSVIIHAGAIIGADGFGYKFRDNQHIKVPHVGNVVIDDNVEIGANTCIDRGALGSTRIGLGSKIDNLVQLGHGSPSKILSLANKAVRDTLRQNHLEGGRDGMDIALLRVTGKQIVYSGANRPLWKISSSGVFEEIKPTKNGIGGYTEEDVAFDEHAVECASGDMIYIFSDGYADQFGGDKGKKLTTKRFRDLLIQISGSHCDEQCKKLAAYLSEWKGNTEQVDDLLVIGIRIQ